VATGLPLTPPARWLVLYDGVCGLCDGLVQFLLARDPQGRFCFAPLQGPTAGALLARLGKASADLDTVYVIEAPATPEERVLSRARAVLTLVVELGGLYRLLAPLRWLPRGLLDWGYDRVARLRYRLFGRLEACRLPSPAERGRFLP
jgi:predicted DCC family thiol-disulfide oxidoreductase YuxK